MYDSLLSHGLQHARLPCPSSTPRFTQTQAHQVGHVIQPLSSTSPSAFNLPSIRVFSNRSVLHIRWPKYGSFSISISPFNKYSGLIYFRINWFDLAVQGTLKSLLQHHISKASILRCSAFSLQSNSHIHT